MKRTLFSCCFLLASLAIPLLSAPHLRTASGWEAPSDDPNGVGHCACPYTYADSYGECFWEDDDCDRAADDAETGQVAELESVLVTDQVEPYDEQKTDYWYDGESGSYYYYEFSDDDAAAVQTVDAASDPLDELFETCEDQASDAPATTEQEVVAEEVVAEEVVAEEVVAEEVVAEEVVAEEVVAEEVVAEEVVSQEAETYGYEEKYDYYAEYEDYGYDFEEYEYRYGEEDDYAYESSDTVDWDAAVDQSVSEPAVAEEAICDQSVSESGVAEEAICDEAVEAVVEDSWNDEYNTEYEDYYAEYDYYYWMDDEEEVATPQDVVATETPAEVVAEPEDTAVVADEVVAAEEIVTEAAEGVADPIESWEYSEYDYGYDSDPYDYDYDSCEYDDEYWEQPEIEAEPVTQEANLPIVADEPVAESNSELPRAAALSLAHTLSRIGSTLQSISEQITEMVDEKVAQQPASETIER